MAEELEYDQLQSLYKWVDDIPFSRPKRNIHRDFADGVLMAEAVKHFFPKLVELHNYSAANSMAQKLYNWTTLNQKALKKLQIPINKQQMESLCSSQPGYIERVLWSLYERTSGGARQAPSPAREEAPRRPKQPSAGSRSVASNHSASPSVAKSSAPPRENPAFYATRDVDSEILIEKEQLILDLREENEILQVKVKKLEQLLALKDAKINALTKQVQGRR